MKRLSQTGHSLMVAAIGLLWLGGVGDLGAEPVGDFSIVDVNPTSPRYETPVSPRDYLHQVSGYYFGDPN
ncbi:MAG: hypothetical protein ACR2RV_04165 [Verrucomicrobiales bacterium]